MKYIQTNFKNKHSLNSPNTIKSKFPSETQSNILTLSHRETQRFHPFNMKWQSKHFQFCKEEIGGHQGKIGPKQDQIHEGKHQAQIPYLISGAHCDIIWVPKTWLPLSIWSCWLQCHMYTILGHFYLMPSTFLNRLRIFVISPATGEIHCHLDFTLPALCSGFSGPHFRESEFAAHYLMPISFWNISTNFYYPVALHSFKSNTTWVYANFYFSHKMFSGLFSPITVVTSEYLPALTWKNIFLGNLIERGCS